MKNKQQILKTLLIAGSLAGAFHAEAASYKRFWRGYTHLDLSSQQFVADVNNKIIPATRELFAKPSGLQSYQPVISNMPSTAQSSLVADEFALLQYTSEAAYRSFRETPEGVAYGDLHWEMFDRATSKSAVVEPYLGAVAVTHAYDLLAQDIDWKKAHTSFTIHTRLAGISTADFLEAVKNDLDQTRDYAPGYGLQALIVLVMDDHVVVYEAWDKESSRLEYHETLDADMPSGDLMLGDVSESPMSVSLYQRGEAPIWPGQGVKIFGR